MSKVSIEIGANVQPAQTGLDRLRGAYSAARAHVVKEAEAMARATQAMSKAGAASGKGGGAYALGAVSMQAQDIAVQLQGGAKAATVLAQQGSQILSFFGPGGAIAGGVLAIGAGIWSWVTNAEEATKRAEELNKVLVANQQATRSAMKDAGRANENAYLMTIRRNHGDDAAEQKKLELDYAKKITEIEENGAKHAMSAGEIQTQLAAAEAEHKENILLIEKKRADEAAKDRAEAKKARDEEAKAATAASQAAEREIRQRREAAEERTEEAINSANMRTAKARTELSRMGESDGVKLRRLLGEQEKDDVQRSIVNAGLEREDPVTTAERITRMAERGKEIAATRVSLAKQTAETEAKAAADAEAATKKLSDEKARAAKQALADEKAVLAVIDDAVKKKRRTPAQRHEERAEERANERALRSVMREGAAKEYGADRWNRMTGMQRDSIVRQRLGSVRQARDNQAEMAKSLSNIENHLKGLSQTLATTATR